MIRTCPTNLVLASLATVDLLGFAPANNPVTFATPPGGNPVAADFRSGEFYQKALSWTNTLIARYEGVDIDTNGGGAPEETRWVFLPKTPENFTHDLDGNLLSDGKWLYTWDGENRLVAMETKSSLPVAMPAVRLEFVYDYMSRRCVKRVYDHSAQGGTPSSGEPTVEGSASAVVQGGQPGSPEGGVIITPPGWTLVSTYKFVWDGWLLIGELDGQNAVVRTCAWGLDLSGSPGGAGGVGGLAFESLAETGATHFALYDGNGNLTSLRDDTGAISAAYEYGPFGETLTTRGNLSALSSNTFKFSTKYTDAESGLLYFGYRYYNQGTGRWLSRDPIESPNGSPSYQYVANRTGQFIDIVGLQPADVEPRPKPELWTASGINNWTQTRFRDYVAEKMKLSSDVSFVSKLGTEDWYKPGGSAFLAGGRHLMDYHHSWGAQAEGMLDKEAYNMATTRSAGEFCRGDCRSTKVAVLLIAPKTTTIPKPDTKCCDVDVNIFFSPNDRVPNQNFTNPNNESWWHRIALNGFISSIDTAFTPGFDRNNYDGDYPDHDLRAFISTDGMLMMTGSHAKVPDAPSQVRHMMSRKVDYVFVGHSQGTNILMHTLNHLCNKNGIAANTDGEPK